MISLSKCFLILPAFYQRRGAATFSTYLGFCFRLSAPVVLIIAIFSVGGLPLKYNWRFDVAIEAQIFEVIYQVLILTEF